MGLTPDQIKALLSTSPRTGKPKTLDTEPREIDVWYKLNHHLREEGCSNENCKDPRPLEDRGRRIVIKLGDVFMCRYCFLEGWLSIAPSTSNVLPAEPSDANDPNEAVSEDDVPIVPTEDDL